MGDIGGGSRAGWRFLVTLYTVRGQRTRDKEGGGEAARRRRETSGAGGREEAAAASQREEKAGLSRVCASVRRRSCGCTEAAGLLATACSEKGALCRPKRCGPAGFAAMRRLETTAARHRRRLDSLCGVPVRLCVCVRRSMDARARTRMNKRARRGETRARQKGGAPLEPINVGRADCQFVDPLEPAKPLKAPLRCRLAISKDYAHTRAFANSRRPDVDHHSQQQRRRQQQQHHHHRQQHTLPPTSNHPSINRLPVARLCNIHIMVIPTEGTFRRGLSF